MQGESGHLFSFSIWRPTEDPCTKRSETSQGYTTKSAAILNDKTLWIFAPILSVQRYENKNMPRFLDMHRYPGIFNKLFQVVSIQELSVNVWAQNVFLAGQLYKPTTLFNIVDGMLSWIILVVRLIRKESAFFWPLSAGLLPVHRHFAGITADIEIVSHFFQELYHIAKHWVNFSLYHILLYIQYFFGIFFN